MINGTGELKMKIEHRKGGTQFGWNLLTDVTLAGDWYLTRNDAKVNRTEKRRRVEVES
jgi:hypothetical protein